MAVFARSISLSQRGSEERITSVVPSSCTDVTRASAGPTASCHAKLVRSGEDGWRRYMAQIQAAANAGNPEIAAAREYVRRAYRNKDGSYMLEEGGSIEADEVAARLMGSRTARFFHEHVLVKEPGATERTPWHHDQPYYPVDGDQNVSMWIALDPVPRAVDLIDAVRAEASAVEVAPKCGVDAARGTISAPARVIPTA